METNQLANMLEWDRTGHEEFHGAPSPGRGEEIRRYGGSRPPHLSKLTDINQHTENRGGFSIQGRRARRSRRRGSASTKFRRVRRNLAEWVVASAPDRIASPANLRAYAPCGLDVSWLFIRQASTSRQSGFDLRPPLSHFGYGRRPLSSSAPATRKRIDGPVTRDGEHARRIAHGSAWRPRDCAGRAWP